VWSRRLLAGCGPLRAGEALGLELQHISSDFRTLSIVQKAKRGLLQPYLKTRNGEREVDLCTSLANMLRDFVGTRTLGLLFQTSTGHQLLQSNTLQDSLHPILKKLKHEKGGFNIFRRYRITQVQKSGCPAALRHFWSGHAAGHVSEPRNFSKSGTSVWNGPNGLVPDSIYPPQLANLANFTFYQGLRKSNQFRRLVVDEKGFEPSASSLRTRQNLR